MKAHNKEIFIFYYVSSVLDWEFERTDKKTQLERMREKGERTFHKCHVCLLL